MKRDNERYNGMNMKQCNVTQAKAMYRFGYIIYVIPCKVRLQNMWVAPCQFYLGSNSEDVSEAEAYADFEKKLNEYNYYNCNYNELGRYANFFYNCMEV